MVTSDPAARRWPELAGRRLLVVGASSGIGRALAVAAARSGATVVLSARRVGLLEETVAEATAAGASAHALACDVTEFAAARSLAPSAGELMGGLDAVVVVAANSPLGRLSTFTAEQWSQVLATNVVGPAMVAAGALEVWRSAAPGRSPHPALVLLSTQIVDRPWPRLVAYAASKAALEALGRGIRQEEPWLRVMNVAVGNTVTGFADAWDPQETGEAFEQWSTAGYFTGTVWPAEQTAAGVLDALVDESGPDDLMVGAG